MPDTMEKSLQQIALEVSASRAKANGGSPAESVGEAGKIVREAFVKSIEQAAEAGLAMSQLLLKTAQKAVDEMEQFCGELRQHGHAKSAEFADHFDRADQYRAVITQAKNVLEGE